MNNWKEVTLEPNKSLQFAIKILDQKKFKIVLIVDKSNRLLGTITDGDIRRALIKNFSMEAQVCEIMNNNPLVAHISENKSVIKQRMINSEIFQMPLVDDKKILLGLEMLTHKQEKKKIDNIVFIMAGGYGKRLTPLTHEIPKPLLKVGSKPILETIIDQFIIYGFYKFYISTHYKAEMIRDYFGDGSRWGINIKYIYEKEPLGTGGALGLLPKKITNLPIIVINGDLLTSVNYEQILQFHSEQGGRATLCVREYNFQVPYGVIDREGYIIKKIIEKPVQNFFINAGIYVIETNIIKDLEGKNYLDLPQLIEKNINDGHQINMFPVHEHWLDIGQMKEYERAHLEFKKFIKK